MSTFLESAIQKIESNAFFDPSSIDEFAELIRQAEAEGKKTAIEALAAYLYSGIQKAGSLTSADDDKQLMTELIKMVYSNAVYGLLGMKSGALAQFIGDPSKVEYQEYGGLVEQALERLRASGAKLPKRDVAELPPAPKPRSDQKAAPGDRVPSFESGGFGECSHALRDMIDQLVEDDGIPLNAKAARRALTRLAIAARDDGRVEGMFKMASIMGDAQFELVNEVRSFADRSKARLEDTELKVARYLVHRLNEMLKDPNLQRFISEVINHRVKVPKGIKEIPYLEFEGVVTAGALSLLNGIIKAGYSVNDPIIVVSTENYTYSVSDPTITASTENDTSLVNRFTLLEPKETSR